MALTSRGRFVFNGIITEKGRLVKDSITDSGTLVFNGTTISGKTYTIVLNDSATLSDTSSRVSSVSVFLKDSISSIEDISGKSISKRLQESIETIDSIQKDVSKKISDNVTSSDLSYKQVRFIVLDSIDSEDSNDSGSVGQRELDDLIRITDSISKKVDIVKYEDIGSCDSESESASKEFLDSIFQEDEVIMSSSKNIFFKDSLSMYEATNKEMRYNIFDSVTLEESIGKSVSLRLYDTIISNDKILSENPNAPTIIGTIKMEGEHELYIYLIGHHNKEVSLVGENNSDIMLRGEI